MLSCCSPEAEACPVRPLLCACAPLAPVIPFTYLSTCDPPEEAAGSLFDAIYSGLAGAEGRALASGWRYEGRMGSDG